MMIVLLALMTKLASPHEKLSCQNEHSRLQASSGGDHVPISPIESLAQIGICVAVCSFDTLSARGRGGNRFTAASPPTSQFK